MLVRWGCEKADEDGVEAYLKASLIGAPMYARHGFQAVKEVELGLTKWGGDEILGYLEVQSQGVSQRCRASRGAPSVVLPHRDISLHPARTLARLVLASHQW